MFKVSKKKRKEKKNTHIHTKTTNIFEVSNKDTRTPSDAFTVNNTFRS